MPKRMIIPENKRKITASFQGKVFLISELILVSRIRNIPGSIY